MITHATAVGTPSIDYTPRRNEHTARDANARPWTSPISLSPGQHSTSSILNREHALAEGRLSARKLEGSIAKDAFIIFQTTTLQRVARGMAARRRARKLSEQKLASWNAYYEDMVGDFAKMNNSHIVQVAVARP